MCVFIGKCGEFIDELYFEFFFKVINFKNRFSLFVNV